MEHSPTCLTLHHTELKLIRCDITECEVDAIVNPANSQLILGGGVAGAILRKGGITIQEECEKLAPCPVGHAVVTAGGDLKARYVIHAVGPRWGEGDEENKLRQAVQSSLKRADEIHVASLALPAISTGIFGFPLQLAAITILEAIRDYLAKDSGLQTVILALFDENNVRVFSECLGSLKAT